MTAHDLVERYLAAVSRRLPEALAKDIVAELREAIASRIEGREAELDQPIDADEVAAILKSFGSPQLAASRYSGREYLIGPGLYPYFWSTQRMAIGIVAVITIILYAMRSLSADEPIRFVMQAASQVWNAGLFTFGVVTAIFVIMETTKAGVRFEKLWDPRSLPREQVAKPRSLFESLLALVFDAAFIAWWVGVLKIDHLLPQPGDGQAIVQMSDAWAPMHGAILALAILTALVHAADVVHPAWSRLRGLATIVGNLGGIAVAWTLLRGPDLVTVITPVGETDRLDRLRILNTIVEASLYAFAVFMVVGVVVEVWRITRTFRGPASAPKSFLA